MKKYLIALAAMALAFGGSTIFTGCENKGENLTGDTTGEKQDPVESEDDINKAEDANTGGGETEEKGEKK